MLNENELFKCETHPFTVFSINRQTEDFVDGLSDAEWTSFAAAVELLTGVLHGEPAVGRISKARGTTNAVYELRIVCGKGPQLRMLCGVDGEHILCARGVDKRQPRLRRHDVELADKALSDCFRARDEQRRRKAGGQGPP